MHDGGPRGVIYTLKCGGPINVNDARTSRANCSLRRDHYLTYYCLARLFPPIEPCVFDMIVPDTGLLGLIISGRSRQRLPLIGCHQLSRIASLPRKRPLAGNDDPTTPACPDVLDLLARKNKCTSSSHRNGCSEELALPNKSLFTYTKCRRQCQR